MGSDRVLFAAAAVIREKLGTKLRYRLVADRIPKCPQQILKEYEVVPGQQDRGDDFSASDDVMQIGTGIGPATVARTPAIDRCVVISVPRIAQIERPFPGEGLAVSARARRQNTVEHIDATQRRADNVVRLADSH